MNNNDDDVVEISVKEYYANAIANLEEEQRIPPEEDIIDSIDTILSYLWHDEYGDYNPEESQDHIFVSIYNLYRFRCMFSEPYAIVKKDDYEKYYKSNNT